MVRRFVVSIPLSLVLLFGILWPATAGDPPAGGVDPTWPPANPFGVTMRSTIDESQGLPVAQQIDARWIRVKLSWELVEPVRTDPPTYDWTFYDDIFGNAAAAGRNVIVTVRDNPLWAGDPAVEAYEWRCGPVADEGTLAQLVVAAAQRYGGAPYHIKLWELYNEPDNTNGAIYSSMGGCFGKYPARYADVLKAVYPALKAAAPDAKVVFGGIGFEPTENNRLNLTFLDDVLRQGAGPYFDLMNVHYFDFYRYNWPSPTNGLRGKIDAVKGIMAGRGVVKPVLVTELGFPYAGTTGASHQANSQYVIKGNLQALAEGVPIIIWYQMIDSAPDPGLYGLMTWAGQSNAGLDAYARLIAELRGFNRAGYYSDPGCYECELHQFTLGPGGRKKIVGWFKHPDGVAPLMVSAGKVRVVSRTCPTSDECAPYGESWITDGGAGDYDGKVNGKVQLRLTLDPIFVEDYTGITPTPSPTASPTGTPTATATGMPTSTPTATSTAGDPAAPRGWLPMLLRRH